MFAACYFIIAEQEGICLLRLMMFAVVVVVVADVFFVVFWFVKDFLCFPFWPIDSSLVMYFPKCMFSSLSIDCWSFCWCCFFCIFLLSFLTQLCCLIFFLFYFHR